MEFPVVDDEKVLQLARGTPGGKVKRWKTGTANKALAKQQEAKIKTDLMMGQIKNGREAGQMTFRALANIYLGTQTGRNHGTVEWKKSTIEKSSCLRLGIYC